MENILNNGEALYNIAAGIGFIAYLMTNVLWLRILLIIGASIYIYTGIILKLDSMVGWHIAYGLINLVQVCFILLDKRTAFLPESIRDIYTHQFQTLSSKEFKRLIHIHNNQERAPGMFLKNGEDNDRLFLILKGSVIIQKKGKTVTDCQAGDFLGEMSLLTGNSICANVIVERNLTYAYWSLNDLKKLETRNPSLYSRFMMAVSYNLAKKLQTSTA